MNRRTHIVLAAAVALAANGFAQAGALQDALNGSVGKSANDYGITFGGWAEGSETWSLSDNDTETLTGRAFDFEESDNTLNQIGFYIDKQTDYGKAWDIGGRFEILYGGDARFTSSNGADLQTGINPDEQFDITQLYAEVVAPIGTGLKIKLGKWNTPLGYEYVNPTLNSLYSHSYLFGLVPFSHTGIYASYNVTETGNLSIGISRGWDQALRDNNGDAFDVVFSWSNKVGDQITYALNGTVGPEQFDDSSHYRTALDFWADYAASDDLTIGVNADYIYDSGLGQDGDAAHTYGVAVYGKYNPKDWKYVGLNARLEWFSDTTRVGGFDSTLYEATLGATITPLADSEVGKNWKIRPEIRWDYAQDDIFNGGADDNQLTAAVETYFAF